MREVKDRIREVKDIEVDATVLLSRPLATGQEFGEFVDDFVNYLPLLCPEYWGGLEPISRKWNSAQIREEMAGREKSILWKRKSKPKGWGEVKKQIVRPQGDTKHANHALFFSINDDEQVDSLIRYLKHVAKKYGADYMCCDSPSLGYRDAARVNGLAPSNGPMFMFTHMLTRCLPDIVWAQIFGPAYIELFGLEKLLSAPAYKVEQLSNEAVYVQLSRSLFDVHNAYQVVEVTRQQVKAHLDNNIFFNSAVPTGHEYRTPTFKFRI